MGIRYPVTFKRGTDGMWFAYPGGATYGAVPIHCTGYNDETLAEPTPYDAKCSLCWLGYAHSGDAHRKEIAK